MEPLKFIPDEIVMDGPFFQNPTARQAGCRICTDSKNLDKGMKEIKELIACAVEIYKEKGEPVPELIDKESYKGKILYRTDSARHYLIAKTAQLMQKSISKTLDILVDKGLQNSRENQRPSK